MDSKINQVSTIIFTILFFLILIYYMNDKGILKYDYVNKLLASEKLNSCANFDLEFKKQLLEINRMLLNFKEFSHVSSQNKEIGLVKLAELIKTLKSALKHNYTNDMENEELSDINYHMKIYDLNKENNNNFECVKSLKIIVQTTICIHDIKKDIHISGSIKNHGVWERDLVPIIF
jgi:hypothetical protein